LEGRVRQRSSSAATFSPSCDTVYGFWMTPANLSPNSSRMTVSAYPVDMIIGISGRVAFIRWNASRPPITGMVRSINTAEILSFPEVQPPPPSHPRQSVPSNQAVPGSSSRCPGSWNRHPPPGSPLYLEAAPEAGLSASVTALALPERRLERAALSDGACHNELPSHLPNDSRDGGDAETAPGELSSEERVEDFVSGGLVHAAPGIPHFKINGRLVSGEASGSASPVDAHRLPPPGSIASAALITRFMTICRTALESPSIQGKSGGRESCNWTAPDIHNKREHAVHHRPTHYFLQPCRGRP
jgi:hypothetical protein